MEKIDLTPIKRYMNLIEYVSEKEFISEMQGLDDVGL